MEENIVNRIYEDIQKSNEPKRYWLYGVSGRYMKAVEVCNKLKIKPYIKFVERAWDKYVEPESGKNVVIINVTTPEELSNIGKFLDKWMNYIPFRGYISTKEKDENGKRIYDPVTIDGGKYHLFICSKYDPSFMNKDDYDNTLFKEVFKIFKVNGQTEQTEQTN